VEEYLSLIANSASSWLWVVGGCVVVVVVMTSVVASLLAIPEIPSKRTGAWLDFAIVYVVVGLYIP
jgi:hypothetical protein